MSSIHDPGRLSAPGRARASRPSRRILPRSAWVVRVAAAALLLHASRAESHATPSGKFPAELDRYIAGAVAGWSIPGAAIAIVRNDSVLVAKGYGVRELGKPEEVDENTVFDVASLSKAFTSTAAAVLVDRHVIRWDDPVTRYLPDLVLPDSALTRGATVRDFLSHRTGLESANMMWVLTTIDRAELLRRMRHLQIQAPPRRRMIYSNIGYTVAGEAMARAAGTSFESLLRDLVIRPLGLTSTTWTYEQAAHLPNVAAPHATIAGRQRPIRREIQRGTIGAAGAVQSTAMDLARWMRFQLNDGVLDGVRFVSDSSMRETHTIQVPIPTTAAMRASRMVEDSLHVGYGLGWQIMDYRGHPLLWHTGNGDGQIAYLALLPRDRLGVAVLVNTWSAPGAHGALLNRILDVYLGFEPRDYVAEARHRATEAAQVQDSLTRDADAMRRAPPPWPLARCAGRYDHPLYGPIFVRVEGSGLTLQMGHGQVADLEYHGDRSFSLRWRDPLFRENFGAMLDFESARDSIQAFHVRINRDEFRATRGGAGD